MVYIDFDGVILDTEELLFEEWRKKSNHKLLSEEVKIEYIKRCNWEHILYNSSIINDSVYYLKQMDPNTSFILTKVHSLENEASSKIKWIREQGIKQGIFVVPYPQKKTDIVDAYGNILVDDCLTNLDDWINNGGYPILFDINDDGFDSWDKPNIKGYQKVLTLKDIDRSKNGNNRI